MTTATGTATVTCEIKGSVDPNNPGHQKTLTATAKDTCETCSAQVDKQVKCGAGPFVDTGFVTTRTTRLRALDWRGDTVRGRTASCVRERSRGPRH